MLAISNQSSNKQKNNMTMANINETMATPAHYLVTDKDYKNDIPPQSANVIRS